MRIKWIFLTTLVLLTVILLPETVGAAETEEEMPRIVPYMNYGGDFFSQSTLTGDWGGIRQDWMDKGLRFDMSLTQTLQRNLAGGTAYEGSYTGNLRYGLQLDTGYMGLWPGGMLTIRGMSRYGHSNNPNVGAILPVNTEALYPVPGQDISCLTDLYFMQFVSPQIGFLAGKICSREENVFAHDETTQFFNTAFNYNPVVATTVPLSFEAAGVIVLPTDWMKVMTLVLDSEGSANHCGFPEAFERGTSVYQNLSITIKPWGLTGHQRVGWTWSDKKRIRFNQTDRNPLRAIITKDITLDTKSTDWSFSYDFDQYIYNEPGSKDQGIGIFGRFGITSGDVNPFEEFYSIGIGGKGIIPGRDNDTFGAGYYYLSLSGDLMDAIDRLSVPVRPDPEDHEQGVEIYYNVAVTPWLHITPDLQIINPVGDGVDTTVVAGLRAKIDF